MSKQILAITGATGAQGGSLARAVLDDPASPFAVRAITRNPDSDKARALAARGAEVVQADLDDAESLARAFAGADAAFCVTNFWEHFSPEREIAQAHNLAEAAHRAGVRHAVWSTLEDTRETYPLDDARVPTLQGRYKVPHFDAKGEADARFRALGVPTTFVRASFYWENFIYFGMEPRRGDDGILYLVLPMGDRKMSGIAAADIGRCVYGIFREGPALAGQVIGLGGEHLSGHEMAAKMGAALGEEVRYMDVPVAAYRAFGFPGAEDLGNMFQFYQDTADLLPQVRSVERSRELNPALQDFSTWLASNASLLPVAPVGAALAAV